MFKKLKAGVVFADRCFDEKNNYSVHVVFVPDPAYGIHAFHVICLEAETRNTDKIIFHEMRIYDNGNEARAIKAAIAALEELAGKCIDPDVDLTARLEAFVTRDPAPTTYPERPEQLISVAEELARR